MNFFDRVNFVGRVLIGIYFLFSGIHTFIPWTPNFSHWNFYFLYFIAIWYFIGGICLILGIKPRASAGIIAFFHLLLIIFHLAHDNWNFMLNQLLSLGALLFIAGTRIIPYGLMIRSEDSMKQKYGNKKS